MTAKDLFDWLKASGTGEAKLERARQTLKKGKTSGEDGLRALQESGAGEGTIAKAEQLLGRKPGNVAAAE